MTITVKTMWCFINEIRVIYVLPVRHMKDDLEDTKVVIRIRQSKKDRQHNGQKIKNKMTSNDLQITTQKQILKQ